MPISVPTLAAPAVPSEDDVVDVEALYRAHARSVARWAARLGGPSVDLEDVVQEVFLVAKRRLRVFEGGGKITTWLFRTTEKIVQAARRKRWLRTCLSRSSEAAASGVAAPRLTPAEALEREQTIEQVYRVLDRLSERDRCAQISLDAQAHRGVTT